MAVKLWLTVMDQGKVRSESLLHQEPNFYLMDEFLISIGGIKDILNFYRYQITLAMNERKETISSLDDSFVYLSLFNNEDQEEYEIVYGNNREEVEIQLKRKEIQYKRKIKNQLINEIDAIEKLKLLLSSHQENDYYLFSQHHRNWFRYDFNRQIYRIKPRKFAEHIEVWLNDLSKDPMLRYHRLRYIERTIGREVPTYQNLSSRLKRTLTSTSIDSILPQEKWEFDSSFLKDDQEYLYYLISRYGKENIEAILSEYDKTDDRDNYHIDRVLVKK